MKRTNSKAKSIFIIFSIFILALLSATSVSAKTNKDTVYLEVQFPEPTIAPSVVGPEYSHIEMEGLRSLGEVGEPVLPIKGLKVLIPDETKIKHIDITLGEKVTLPGTYMIEPAQQEYPLSQIDKLEIKPDGPTLEVYQNDAPYPDKLHKVISLQKKMGYPIAAIDLYPVEYNPKKGEVTYYKGMSLAIRLEPDTKLFTTEELKTQPRLRTKAKVKDQDISCLQRLIDNPEDLSLYDQGLTQTTTELQALGAINPLLEYDSLHFQHNGINSSFHLIPSRSIRLTGGILIGLMSSSKSSIFISPSGVE